MSKFTKPEPRTSAQSKRIFSNDAIKKLTKQEIQRYLESFFNKAGHNYDLLKIVSPSSLKYNTDRSFDPAIDPTQRKMQIARYFNELRAILPSILILDGGITPYSQTIGLLDSAHVDNGFWVGMYPITKLVPITIVFAARDMESADELSGVASLMFNELRNIAGGSYISGNRDEGETWVIYLPNQGVTVGQLSDTEVDGDPIEKIWYAELSFDVYFEDVIAVREKLPSFESSFSEVNQPNLAKAHKPEIVIADSLSINQSYVLLVRNITNQHAIRISDPNIATLTHTMQLNPRRYGSVDIVVLDMRRPQNDQEVARKTIQII